MAIRFSAKDQPKTVSPASKPAPPVDGKKPAAAPKAMGPSSVEASDLFKPDAETPRKGKKK